MATPRQIPGGRTKRISYRAIRGEEDIKYNIEQLFQLAQDASDNITRLTVAQNRMLKEMAVLNKKIEELSALIP